MAYGGFLSSSGRLGVAVDMGHPFLNRTVDGFLKIRRRRSIASVYVGVECGIERIRGHRDWKNAMLGGAVTGALVSAANSKHRQDVVKNAITGGAIATAAQFLNYLT